MCSPLVISGALKIDSRDRDSGTSSNYQLTITDSPGNIIGYRVSQIWVPYSFYNVPEDLTLNAFTIPKGQYTIDDLLTTINTVSSGQISGTYNDITMLVTLTSSISTSWSGTVLPKLGIRGTLATSLSIVGVESPNLFATNNINVACYELGSRTRYISKNTNQIATIPLIALSPLTGGLYYQPPTA